MRFHRSTTEAVCLALEQIFNEGRYADKVIEKVLKQNPKWGARDRRFIAETTYDIVRWYLLIRYMVRAKENDYWRLIAGWSIIKEIPLPDWREFSGVNITEARARYHDAQQRRSVRESIPEWLDQLGAEELRESWDKELRSLNEEAMVVLRANTLKISADALRVTLQEDGVETDFIKGHNDALVLAQRQNVFTLPAFKEGLFEVQDAASQAVAPFLKLEPGMRVIDACAGAGGKTLHIAALMKNKGRIIAMDVEQWKLDELQKRARRAGVSNLEARLIDSSKIIKRLDGSADRLLLDVPCSGLGVLKRNPDAKWKLSTQFVDEVKAAQKQILADYSEMVKPGGMMVYSTCSILPSENRHQIEYFLERKSNFELVKDEHLWPSQGFDGFYMALLRRKG